MRMGLTLAALLSAVAARGLSLKGAIDVRGVPGVTLQDNEITALGEPLP